MVDAADAIGKARKAVTERAELPGMSLMEHLDELRKRIVHSAVYLAVGLHHGLRLPREALRVLSGTARQAARQLNYTHPMDPLNLYLQVSLIGGAILASPFILYQVWLFIAPGLYQKEKRFVVPFMAATVGLFLTGASLRLFLGAAGRAQDSDPRFRQQVQPMITIEEYTGFFLSIILGLGISFELPILIFFLALFGIVSPRFLWKNIRYAILAVFLVAAIICPSPDPWTMCIYAIPMLALYMVGIGVAWWVHPSQAKGQRGRGARVMCSSPRQSGRWVPRCLDFDPWDDGSRIHRVLRPARLTASAQQHFDGAKAYEYARQFVAIGPRWPTGPGHLKAEAVSAQSFQHARSA